MFDVFDNPSPAEIARSPDEFLAQLSKPTVIRVTGKNPSRTRALVTLLHGNEPSGFFAVHRWLMQGLVPPTNLIFIFGNIPAAKLSPVFSTRQLPEGRDMNRCFRAPYTGFEGEVAEQILDLLHTARPEALIDMHNTSGTGPSFGVTINLDERHLALTSLFTERLMYTDLRLGALMEFSERDVPTVTIEVGGAQDDHAHALAYEGLQRYIAAEDVLVTPAADWNLDVLRQPVRVELNDGIRLAYGESPSTDADLTLRADIEHLNFGVVKTDVCLGWVGESVRHCFRTVNGQGQEISEKILRIEDGKLYPAQDIKAFMITANPVIAKSDCLCYVVTDRGETIA